jgi:hypothetical protein
VNGELLGEAIDTAFTLARAYAAWIVIGGMAVSALLLGVAAGIAWVWRAVRKRLRRPSWVRGRRKARILAHARAKPSGGLSEPPGFEEAA